MTKKILITGKNSYIGNQLEEWLNKESENYEVVKKSVRDNKWKDIDFSVYDVVVHVAGIAHQDSKSNQGDLYYRVNTNLTIDIATRAKEKGVKQFIFLSSIIIYGSSGKIGESKVITKETLPSPENFYGNSKLLAEKGILPLQSKNFNVAVIRPPMIYGKNSKGNYLLLSKLSILSPVFLNIYNQRSMLHIDNLTEFIRLIIKNSEEGVFLPQNNEFICTSQLVLEISKEHKRKVKLIKLPEFITKKILSKIKIFNKIFGNLVYEKEISKYKDNYTVRSFLESIKLSEDVKNGSSNY